MHKYISIILLGLGCSDVYSDSCTARLDGYLAALDVFPSPHREKLIFDIQQARLTKSDCEVSGQILEFVATDKALEKALKLMHRN